MKEQALVNLALSENGFLFDTTSGNTFTLNKTAGLILKGLIAGMSPETISEDLSEFFDVPYEMVSGDVQQFIHHLGKINVIPETEFQD